ncbi:MAG: LptF/LptG family permease, partial [Bacillota bacterium]
MLDFWKIRIVDKYIIKEVLLPFIVSVAIITVIFLSGLLYQLTDFIIVKDIPVNVILRLLLFELPALIVETFPIAILFATMSGMSRLNRENEFSALRLGGISLYRLVMPLILLGLLVSCITFLMNDIIVPWTNHKAQNIIRYSILKQTMPDVQEDTFFEANGRLYYVGEFNEKQASLHKIVIFNFPEKREYPEIITAETGKVVDNKWQLTEGLFHHYDEKGHLSLESQFEQMEIELAKDIDNFFSNQKTPAEMSREELKEDIDLFQESGLKVDSLVVEYHKKIAKPMIALIFILVGVPLSLSSKDSRSASIVFTIAVIFLYYLVDSVTGSFGKNGTVLPLLAAWLPNIIFVILGIILLIWRESWQRLLQKYVPFFLLILCLCISPGSTVQAESVKLETDNLVYNHDENTVNAIGEVMGKYREFNIIASKLIVKLDDGNEETSKKQELVFTDGKITGCDLEKPHYYFQAEEVVIYPDDYLIARHVVFRELNGKLPLLYLPVLYIDLKEKSQKLTPDIGYSSTRGWFLKTTYSYWYKKKYPGKIFTDYYTKSGFAGGFEQYFLYEDDLKASLYLYGQENRTDIPGLFVWKGRFNIVDNRGDLKNNSNLTYTKYSDYTYLTGKANLNTRDKNYNFILSSNYSSREYEEKDYLNQKDMDFDLKYNYNLPSQWKLHIDYNRDYLLKPDTEILQSWNTSSYLSRRFNNLNFKLLMERKDPGPDDEDNIRHKKWPEITLGYTPTGIMKYNLALGKYYEDITETTGYRGMADVRLAKNWRL